MHAEPPVFVVKGLVDAAEAAALVDAARSGDLPPVAYEDEVLIDWRTLVPRLAPLVLVAALPRTLRAWEATGEAPAALAAFAGAAGLAAAAAGALALLGRWAVERSVGGRVFTGTKWDACGAPENSAAASARDAFRRRLGRLLVADPRRFERPTVTRYVAGEEQRVHSDARIAGDTPERLAEYAASGGQRLVQCVVYLNDVPADGGGATKFYHPSLGGLTVQPRLGDALVFFPAFADGTADERMPHAGEVVLKGEKWTINTWCCEGEVPGSAP